MHYELLTVQATQPNTGAAGAANTGDSLTVKNGRGNIRIIAGWATRQVAGFTQLIWPSGHDTTRNYRAGVAIGAGQLTLPLGCTLELEAQEVLASQIAGSNTAGDIELDSFLIHYDDFPGISMRTIGAVALESRTEKHVTVEASVAAVATGQYSTEAINADSDLLKANRDYAVIGMSARTAAHALTIAAPDFGNIRVGCPGALKPELSCQWFALLSRVHGLPLVPVFNTGNKGQVTVGFCADENAATTLITVYLAMLK